MKPINIKICAFGPYKDEVNIDFTKFYDSGIFLITGDTGSGKTTIFDAICFALFGTASGSNRGKNSFRSDFALDDVKTYVILEFVHKGINYKIERNPGYMRKKKRGDGYTQVSGDASMVYLDQVITGEKNVTDKCIEILGINAMQFKQISMIAQGEFLKLLLAKPGERADIFRKVFDTYIYRDISDGLKKKYLDTKREYEDVSINIDSLKNSVIFDDDILIEEFNLGDFLDIVSKVICKDEKLEKELEQNKTKILDKIQKITNDISNACLVNDNFDKYETTKKMLEVKLESESDIDSKRVLIDKNKDIFEKIVPLHDEVVKLDKMISDKELELSKNKELFIDVCCKYNEIFSKYKNIDLDRKKIYSLKLNLSELKNKLPLFQEIDSLNKELLDKNNIYNLLKLEELNGVIKKFDDNKKLQVKYESCKANFLEIKDKYNKLSSEYNSMYNKFISCQAGIIASDLKNNCPCPVCGSLTHPCKAKIEGEYITKEKVDFSKKDLDKCQVDLEKTSSDVSSLKKELDISNRDIKGIDIDILNKEINSYKDKVVKDMDVSKYNINDILGDISYIKASIDSKRKLINDGDTEEKIKKQVKDINLEIDKINKYITSICDEYKEVSDKKVSISSVIEVLDREIGDLKNSRILKNDEYVGCYKELGYDTDDDYLKVKLDKDLYLEYIEEVNGYDNDIRELNSKIDTIKEIIKDKKRIDTSDLEKCKLEKNAELSKIELSLKNVHSRLNNNKIVYDKLCDVYKKVQNLEERLSLIEDLSNTANGNIKGKNKLEFEQYVQASYFDNVLVSANKRFSYMTDDRYLLARKVEASRLSDKLGLELEIIDNYTGKRREVTSLSGGESFKASLSLALGISDVIQSYAGGIVVETMFIDEGFGSLDSESLEASLNAIMMLNDNDRLIGIISHVSELKDRIDKKIVVKNGNNGSSVNAVV